MNKQFAKKIALSVCVSVIAISAMTCANKKNDSRQRQETMATKRIEAVLKEHTTALMAVPGVVGTAHGLCNNKPCIKVYVVNKTPELDQKIPDILEGYPVIIEETGEFRALPENQH